MILYQLKCYNTKAYNSRGQTIIRFKDTGFACPKLERWIRDFLTANPDGKIVVSIVEKKRGGKTRKTFTQTAEGRKYA